MCHYISSEKDKRSWIIAGSSVAESSCLLDLTQQLLKAPTMQQKHLPLSRYGNVFRKSQKAVVSTLARD